MVTGFQDRRILRNVGLENDLDAFKNVSTKNTKDTK